MAKKKGTRKVARSAKSGKFVRKSAAKKNPATTVVHTYKKSPRARTRSGTHGSGEGP